MFWQLLDVSWVSFSELTMVAGFGTNTRSCRSNEHLRLATLLAQAWAWYGYTLSLSIKREREREQQNSLWFAWFLHITMNNNTMPICFMSTTVSHAFLSPCSPIFADVGAHWIKMQQHVSQFFGYEPRPIKVEELNYWAPRFEIFW